MELERVIEILEKHQDWRRDQNVAPKTEMQSPIEIGTAIDYALIELKKLRLGNVSESFCKLNAYKDGYCNNYRCKAECNDCDFNKNVR
jgi:hypothetical protein